MKKSIIKDYLKALNTIVNDNRISFAITGNFADKCYIVAYWCKNQVLHNFILFNDSSVISYDNLVNDYFTIMAKHPTKQGDKQLFSLRYDSKGYCSLAVSYNSSNLELFGVSHKRISKKLANYLFDVVVFNDNYYISDYRDKYITSVNFNKNVLFSL